MAKKTLSPASFTDEVIAYKGSMEAMDQLVSVILLSVGTKGAEELRGLVRQKDIEAAQTYSYVLIERGIVKPIELRPTRRGPRDTGSTTGAGRFEPDKTGA
jgi:hypothetical protein